MFRLNTIRTCALFLFSFFTFISAQNINVPSKVTAAFPLFDDAEDTTASYAEWTRDASQWEIKTVNAKSGTQAWVMQGNNSGYNYLTLSSGMNLSNTPNPYIQCWVRRSDGGGGYILLDASTDGGSSWKPILNQYYFSGSPYTRIQGSLYNYRESNVLIRIGCYSNSGSYYVDDILIDNAPTPTQTFVMLNPTNNGMEVKWGQSTASDFGLYRIVLSTNQNVLKNDLNNFNFNGIGFYAATDVSGRNETKVFDITNISTLDTVLTDLIFTNTTYYGKIYEQDTQGLVNQGSVITDRFTMFTMTTETAPFTETFETSYKLAADIPWAVTTDDASDAGHSTTHAYEDSPLGNYPANADRNLVIKVNFGNMQHPVLRYNQKYSYEQNYDYGNLYMSSDDGGNWTKVASFTGNTGGLWESRDFDAGMLKGTSGGLIAFKTTSNGAGVQQDGWHLDDIQIYNNTRTTTFPFFDDVSVDTTSQKKWIPGAWSIKIAGDHSGDSQVWYLPQNNTGYVYLTLGGPMNLSGTPNPYVQFWVKRDDGGGGYTKVEVSNDGGVQWQEIRSQTYFSGASYTRIQASLYNHRENNVMVRIGCYANSGKYYVDDILIDNAPTPTQTFLMLNPTNNGMEFKWGKSTASDFDFYRIVISTRSNTLDNDLNNSNPNNGFYTSNDINGHNESRVFDISNVETTDTVLTDLTFTNTHYYAKIYEQDSTQLVNQGSEKADYSTQFNVIPEVAPFTETFEGTEGTDYKWAADIPWTVTQADSADTLHSATHAFEDSPNGNYDANADRRLVVQMNLSSIVRPLLNFNHKYAFEQNYDYGYVDYSSDNATWKPLASFTGNSGGVWEAEEFDLSPLSQQSAGYLRFTIGSNGPGVQQDGWHLDDIQIMDNKKITAIPFIDSVEVDSASKTYWTAGTYKISIAKANSGQQVWYCPQNNGGYNYITLRGVTDLSSAPKPYVSFWVIRNDGGGGYYRFEVSNDGGQNWTNFPQQYFSGNTYTHGLYSLADYRQKNVLIRIGLYANSGAYYLDDIEFADSTGYVTGMQGSGLNNRPKEFSLSQNYPNPFNPSTTIRYAVPSEAKVKLNVYNLLGQIVTNLVDNVEQTGYHEVVFNAANLASGIYFYTIDVKSTDGKHNFQSAKKLILMK